MQTAGLMPEEMLNQLGGLGWGGGMVRTSCPDGAEVSSAQWMTRRCGYFLSGVRARK